MLEVIKLIADSDGSGENVVMQVGDGAGLELDVKGEDVEFGEGEER